jgi:acylpyruvate hydrolase
MKLATAFVAPEVTRLYAATAGGFHEVGEEADLLGVGELAGMEDVGALLRAGDGAVAAVAELVAAAERQGRQGVPLERLRLAPPVTRPAAIVCIGRNYAAHAAESGSDAPPYPQLFAKFRNTLLGSGGTVPYPSITERLDYEGELVAVIGRRASKVAAADAGAVIAGYTIMNDVSARDLQRADLQWIRGKSLDGFAPLGPVVATADEIGGVADVDALRLETRVNGELRQDAACGEMIFKLPALIEFITEGITLEPGDLIATGTPSGVGFAFDPPRWLGPGDVVDVSIDRIGTLRCSIGRR